jgi:hypothetical protein
MGRLSPQEGAKVILVGLIVALLGGALMPLIAQFINESALDLETYGFADAATLWRLFPLAVVLGGVLFILGGVIFMFI